MSFSQIILNIFGVIVFLFIFWRNLKEDYLPAQIFSTAFYILAGILLTQVAASQFFPSWWFWAAILGITAGFIVGKIRFKLKVLETLEATVSATLPWLFLIFLDDAVRNSSLSSFLATVVSLGLIFTYLFLDAHYRKFSWYKSGKVGFSALTTLGILFLIRAFIAIGFTNMVSFSGKSEAFLSGIIAITSFLAVFNLARKTQ